MKPKTQAMCPDQGSNQQPFGAQDDIQRTEPHWAGCK